MSIFQGLREKRTLKPRMLKSLELKSESRATCDDDLKSYLTCKALHHAPIFDENFSKKIQLDFYYDKVQDRRTEFRLLGSRIDINNSNFFVNLSTYLIHRL